MDSKYLGNGWRDAMEIKFWGRILARPVGKKKNVFFIVSGGFLFHCGIDTYVPS
jgi:hypothetical protein